MRFIGDVHGNLRAYLFLTMGAKESIQVGDFGMGFIKPDELKDWNTSHDHENHRFIRGNHDHLLTCLDYKSYIPDGHVEERNGKKWMYMGGAFSVDRNARVLGVSWWEDEELSVSEWEYLIDEYEKEKPDVVITHDCPRSVSDELFRPRYRISSSTSNALEIMRTIHEPQDWIFGHWHPPFTIQTKVGNTLYHCVAVNDSVDIDDL